MSLRIDYPYDEAVNDLRVFFDNRIIHSDVKAELNRELDASLKRKTVPMRYLFDQFIRYTNEHKLFDPYTNEEEKLINELLHFWG